MHVRVDVTGQDEFADATDRASGILHNHTRGDARDAPVVDENRRVTGNFPIGGIYDCSPNKRDMVGTRRQLARNLSI